MPSGRATQRSQRSTKTYSARAGPSQTQRSRGVNLYEDDDEEESGGEEQEVIDMDVDEDETDAELTRMANDFARLLLFYEHRRIPVRRDEISKKVMSSYPRVFNLVLAKANQILLNTFGYEIVELPSRAGLEQTQVSNKETELEEARAAGLRKKAAATGSKQYVLRSVLDQALIERSSQTDMDILNQELQDVPPELEDDDDLRPKTYGSIISWSQGEQVGNVGILYVILALILVHGRVMSDMDLRSQLKQLKLYFASPVFLTAHSTHQSLTFEQYLNNLLRQGYLERHQTGDTKGKGKAGNKRVRATQAEDDNGVTYEWRWGTRAHVEVGENAIAEFVADFMVKGGGDDEDDDDDESDDDGPGGSRTRTARKEQKQAATKTKFDRMKEGIVKAAGGNLSEINEAVS